MLHRLRLPLLAALAIAAVAFATRPLAAHAARARPLVLVVHGRGYLARDSADFRRTSLHALRQGAFAVTNDSLFTDDDVRIVWYADLLDMRNPDSSATRGCAGASPTMSIFQFFANVASELIDANPSDLKDDARSLAGDLRFFGDATTRCAAEGRIGSAIARAHDEGRPIVLVGHSLGALVTWGHLQHRAQSGQSLADVQRLVTVGSPIGSRGLRELLLSDSSALSLPRGVGSWVNVVNESDPFASRLVSFDSTLGRVRELPGVADVLMPSGDEDAHELRGYLRAPAAASAIVGAWCDAFSKADRPGACARH